MAVLSPFFLSVSATSSTSCSPPRPSACWRSRATYVICSGGLDLSLGSVMGLCRRGRRASRSTSWACRRPSAISPASPPAAFAGYQRRPVTRATCPAFIVTLGMLGIARGAALVLSDGRGDLRPAGRAALSRPGPAARHPDAVLVIFVGRRAGRALRARLHHASAATRWRSATTRARRAPPASGSSATAVKLYTLSGTLAGLAGMLFMARVNAGDPTAGLNYELTAITAAIIGGTNLFGGRGIVLGTMIGALIMGVLQNGLNLLAVQSYYQQMAIGAVLILAVFSTSSQRLQGEPDELVGPRGHPKALRRTSRCCTASTFAIEARRGGGPGRRQRRRQVDAHEDASPASTAPMPAASASTARRSTGSSPARSAPSASR